MREITSGPGVQVEPWTPDAILAGRFVDAKMPPNAQSFIYTLHSKAGPVGFWGSTQLDAKMAGIQRNEYVVVKCHGKKVNPKNAREFWAFTVLVLEGTEPEEYEAGKLDPFGGAKPEGGPLGPF